MLDEVYTMYICDFWDSAWDQANIAFRITRVLVARILELPLSLVRSILKGCPPYTRDTSLVGQLQPTLFLCSVQILCR
jgi:hypothetical protein